LSLFLSEFESLKEKGKIEEMKNIVFKGGTLLTKNYLNYHRISEDNFGKLINKNYIIAQKLKFLCFMNLNKWFFKVFSGFGFYLF
jgi:hypothetical protein